MLEGQVGEAERVALEAARAKAPRDLVAVEPPERQVRAPVHRDIVLPGRDGVDVEEAGARRVDDDATGLDAPGRVRSLDEVDEDRLPHAGERTAVDAQAAHRQLRPDRHVRDRDARHARVLERVAPLGERAADRLGGRVALPGAEEPEVRDEERAAPRGHVAE